MKNATATCTNHRTTGCPAYKPFVRTCWDCGKAYCSNLDIDTQCRSCYLNDEWEAGIL